MEDDQRDIIWNSTYYMYYDTYFYEIVSAMIVSKWTKTNDIAKLLIAITTSGSAISGWALWKNNIGIYLWLSIVGVSSILSIINATWGVTNKIKEWTDLLNHWTNLRIEMEIFKDKMLLNRNFDVDDFQKTLINFKRSFGEEKKRLKPDFFMTAKLNKLAQDDLNIYIKTYKNNNV